MCVNTSTMSTLVWTRRSARTGTIGLSLSFHFCVAWPWSFLNNFDLSVNWNLLQSCCFSKVSRMYSRCVYVRPLHDRTFLVAKCACVPCRLWWHWMWTSKQRNQKCSNLLPDFIQSSRRSKLTIVCNFGLRCFSQFQFSFFSLQVSCQYWPSSSTRILFFELS